MKKLILAGGISVVLFGAACVPNVTIPNPQPVTVTPRSVPTTVQPTEEPSTPSPSPSPTFKTNGLTGDYIKNAFTKGGFPCDWDKQSNEVGEVYACSKYGKILFAVTKNGNVAQQLASNLEAEAPQALQGYYMVVIGNAVFLFGNEKLAENFAEGADRQATQI